MPRQIPEPDIEYEQVPDPDPAAIEAAFDLLFDLVTSSDEADGGSTNRGQKLE